MKLNQFFKITALAGVIILAFWLSPKRSAFGEADDVAGQIASAGLACAMTATKLAIAADWCESQAATMDTAIQRGLLGKQLAEKALHDAMCKDEKQKLCEEVASAAPAGKSGGLTFEEVQRLHPGY